MPNVANYPDLVAKQDAIIPSGGQISGPIDCRGTSAAMFYIPAGFESTYISFHVSYDGQNFFELLDPETAISVKVNVVAGKATYVHPIILSCVQYFKVATATAETNERAISVAMRRFQ